MIVFILRLLFFYALELKPTIEFWFTYDQNLVGVIYLYAKNRQLNARKRNSSAETR